MVVVMVSWPVMVVEVELCCASCITFVIPAICQGCLKCRSPNITRWRQHMLLAAADVASTSYHSRCQCYVECGATARALYGFMICRM